MVTGPIPATNKELGLSVPDACQEVPVYKEVIKGDSQKVDNAQVPDHLWLQAFAAGSGIQGCLEQHWATLGLPTDGAGLAEWEEGRSMPLQGWQGSMRLFRSLGLRFWKRGIVLGYAAW